MLIAGAWIDEHAAYTWRGGRTLPYRDLAELKDICAGSPAADGFDWSDFRRANRLVRMSLLTAALTALDAPVWDPAATAAIGWNGIGTRSANRDYWADYVDNGRLLGRGSLFVATLPSIPICEAAIMLHLHGEGFYLKTARETACLQRQLDDLFSDDRDLRHILILETGENACCGALVTREMPALPAGETLESALRRAAGDPMEKRS